MAMKAFLCIRLALALTLLPLENAWAVVRATPGLSVNVSPSAVSVAGASASAGGPAGGLQSLQSGVSIALPLLPGVQTPQFSAASDGSGYAAAASALPASAVSGEQSQASRARRDFDPAGPSQKMTFQDLAELPVQWKEIDAKPYAYQNLELILSDHPEQKQKILSFLRTNPEMANSIFDGMFLSLDSIIDSDDIDGLTRAQSAAALSGSFNDILAEIKNDPTLSDKVRKQAEDNIRHFMTEYRLVSEFMRKREAAVKLARLRESVAQITGEDRRKPLVETSMEQTENGAETRGRNEKPDWKILPHNPNRYWSDTEETISYSLDDFSRDLDQAAFFLEKLKTRYMLAAEKGFSSKFISDRAREMSEYIHEIIFPLLQNSSIMLPRYVMISLGRTFQGINMRTRPDHVWIPNNPNLRMHAVKGGVVVTARFETRIDNDDVLTAVKKSIEYHWHGAFEAEGEKLSFKTIVTIDRLAPAQNYSKNALKLIEDDVANAKPDHLAISREFQFDVPAHEFGHILGLPDEYVEYYDGEKRSAFQTSNNGSIMGLPSLGTVQSRHLHKAAYLLKKHSFTPPLPK